MCACCRACPVAFVSKMSRVGVDAKARDRFMAEVGRNVSSPEFRDQRLHCSHSRSVVRPGCVLILWTTYGRRRVCVWVRDILVLPANVHVVVSASSRGIHDIADGLVGVPKEPSSGKVGACATRQGRDCGCTSCL